MKKKEEIHPGTKSENNTKTRREFLGNVSGLTPATIAAGVAGLPALDVSAQTVTSDSAPGQSRAEKAFETRVQAALFQKIAPHPDHRANGDEDLYASKIGSFTKGLRHNQLGEVDPVAWETFMRAIESRNPDDFEGIMI